MGEEELQKEIHELRNQLAQLSEAIERVTKPYQDVLGRMDELQDVARRYFGLLDLYQRYGEISPEIIVPEMKDPISRDIVKILFDKGDRNISQIAGQLRQRRGTASRRIVRARLDDLVEKGVVTMSSESKARRYSVSDDVLQKWSQVLGLYKYQGQRSDNQGKKEGV